MGGLQSTDRLHSCGRGKLIGWACIAPFRRRPSNYEPIFVSLSCLRHLCSGGEGQNFNSTPCTVCFNAINQRVELFTDSLRSKQLQQRCIDPGRQNLLQKLPLKRAATSVISSISPKIRSRSGVLIGSAGSEREWRWTSLRAASLAPSTVHIMDPDLQSSILSPRSIA